MKYTFDLKVSPVDADLIKADIESRISVPSERSSVIPIAGFGLRVILTDDDATWLKSKYGHLIIAK